MRSSRDKGTLYQLHTLINRTLVPTDPSKNMNSEDILLLILHALTVIVTKQILSKENTYHTI